MQDYDSYVNIIKEDIKSLRATAKTVEYLEDQKYSFIELRNNIEKNIRETDATVIAASSLRDFATRVLLMWAERAVVAMEEFNTPMLATGLYRAINDPRTIQIDVNPTTGSLKVKIDLDRTAGTLDDYGAAVSATREALQIGPNSKSPMSPALASKMWKEKYYKPARQGTDIPQPIKKSNKSGKPKKERKYDVEKYIAAYWKTIQTRVSFFNGLAPWWRILNYGMTELSSDYGGTGYRQIKPTRFVERAEREIRRSYTARLSNINEDIKIARQDIIALDRAVRFCDHLINRIEQKINQSTQRVNQKTFDLEDFVLDQIKKQVGDYWGYVDTFRLEDLVTRLLLQVPISEERVELTSRGSPKRVRIRYLELQRKIQEFKDRQR